MGRIKRPLYKRERPPARTKGTLRFNRQAPVGLPTANNTEIALALHALCDQAGVVIGRGGTYDNLKDEYTIIGKSKFTGKAQDFYVKGDEVAKVIALLRMCEGGELVLPSQKMLNRAAEIKAGRT